jgi:hypothetical protein
MKRFHIFPVFFIFSVLFACQIPTAIEVRGTPELHFSAKKDIVSLFIQQMEESFKESNFTMLRCVNTSNLTYLSHKYLFNEQFDINDPPDHSDFDLSILGTLTETKNLIKPDVWEVIPFYELGVLMDGFIFNNAKTFMFVSGKDVLVKKLWLGVTVNGDPDEQKFKIEAGNPSGCDPRINEYFSSSYPQRGHHIKMPLDGSDVIINWRLFGKAGETFDSEDFEDADLKVELVIWLPMEFRAERNGANITFPETFLGNGGNDLFGRDSPDAESAAKDIIESLSLIVKLNTNPFLGNDFVISSGESIEIKERITTNSLNIVFDEKNMELINDPASWPFVPSFKIVFNADDILKFPKVFSTTEIIFTARIKIIIDLKEPPGEKDESGETDEPGETGKPDETDESGETGDPDETDGEDGS